MPDKINTVLLKKWLDALRSGKYEQTRGRLKGDCGLVKANQAVPQLNSNMFCCLGVLCDISGYGYWKQNNPFSIVAYIMDEEQGTTRLPRTLREIVGLTETQEEYLMHLNDRGDSFSKIADWIESNENIG